MSSDLATELSALRTLILTAKDDITHTREAYSHDALATVLGSAQTSGEMDKELARTLCSEHSVLSTLLSSCTDSGAAKEAVAGLMAHSAAAAGDRVCKEAIRLAQDDLVPALDTQVEAIKRSLNLISDQAASIISEAEARANVVTAARAEALRIYTQSWVKIEEASTTIKGIDARLKDIDSKSEALVTNNTLSVDELTDQCASLDKATKFVRDQRDLALSKLAENFGDRKVKGAKPTKITLSIPANLDASKGKQVIDNIRNCAKAQSERFAFIMAELERTDSDYDQKTQSYYKPPALPTEIHKIPEKSREFYTDDATTLYNEVWAKLSTAVQAKLSGTFNYGFGASKLTGTVAKGDGPTLIFALICMFRNCVGLESEIKTLFLLADQGFAKHSNPMITVDNLRASLTKATNLNTSMEWSETGAKMVEQLGYDDHNMAKALEDYTDIQPADNQTVGLIAQMFAIIERMSKKKVSRDSKEGNKRACVANALDTLGINNAQRNKNKRDKPWGECRNGSNCNHNGCKFTHPDDNKNNNNKQMFDNSNKTGGKCEAQDCPAKGESKRLCTTCFKTLLSDGTLKSKTGATIKKSDLSRARPEGFYPKFENKGRGYKRANSAKGNGISASQIEKAWKKAKRGNEQDSTIKGKAAPKSAKLANAGKPDDDDNAAFAERVVKFANSMSNLGVELEGLDIE